MIGVCRVCLAQGAAKDITQLKLQKKEPPKSYIEILLFCLDIQVTQDSKISSKICEKCFKKILTYHKFKALALKNDTYLRSLEDNIKKEENGSDEHDNFNTETLFSLEEDECFNIKQENDSLDEEAPVSIDETTLAPGDDSDDEILSVIKRIKDENDERESKENEQAPVVRRKRGRPKLTHTKHKSKREDKKLEICEQCGIAVPNLKVHLRKHLPTAEPKMFQCDLCEKTFKSKRYRYKHYKIFHLGHKQICSICNKAVVNLRYHTLIRHKPELLPYKCPVCPRGFVSPAGLRAHTVIHTKDKPFSCDICDKRFSQKYSVINHKKQVHEQVRNHLCQFCSNSFFKKYHLQMHLLKHTKEKQHKCPECGKLFGTTAGLKSHRQIHSEVKQYECHLCDTKFAKATYLRNHMITHTKEKRHACKYCGVLFGRSDHRKRHEFTAHEKHLVTTS